MGENLNQTPAVAIVIVTFNDPANLSRCLGSLKKELIGQTLRCHVTVVDNSTDPSSKKNIAQLVRQVKGAVFIDPKTNTGFAKGNNIALKQEFDHGTDYCFLLNSDTELYRGSINELVETQTKTNSALVGPTLVYGDRPKVYWYGGGRWQAYLGIVRHVLRNKPVRPQSAQAVSFVNGAAMLIPKATYLKYGGFFEPYFMYYEDSDYSVQLIRAGEQLYYEPRVVIKHYVPAVTDKSALAIFYLTRNHWLFWVRTTSGLARLTAVVAICIFQVIRLLKNLDSAERRRAIGQAWVQAFNKQYGKTF